MANKIDYNNFRLWRIIIPCIMLIPHLILLLVLSIDVFYSTKLLYFYKAIWFTLFLFIIPFSLYSFNYLFEYYMLYWEKNTKAVGTLYKQGVLPPIEDYWYPDYDDSEDDDDCTPPETMYISYSKFIPIYFNEVYYEFKTPGFYYVIHVIKQWYDALFKKYNVNWDTCSKIKEELIEKDLNLRIRSKTIQKTYNVLATMTDITITPLIIKYARIIIYMGYLICWSYILCISLYNIKDTYTLYFIKNIFVTYFIQLNIPYKISILLIIGLLTRRK